MKKALTLAKEAENPTVNDAFDFIVYESEQILHKLGIKLPIFKIAHRSKTFLKFGVVGVTGTIVDFGFYSLFISHFGLLPAIAKMFSGECGVVNNFVWNNFWTFKHRKTSTNLPTRFLVFNAVSVGGILIGAGVVAGLHVMYGDGDYQLMKFKIAYTTLYFFATIPPVMAWNFTVNSLVTWKSKK